MLYGIIFYILSLLLVLAFSAVYLQRASFMPYHQQAVQRSWQEVDPKMQQLVLALMRALGLAWLSWLVCCAYLLFLLLKSPVNMGQLALFQVFYFLSALAPVMVALRLRLQTGARTPIFTGVVAAGLSALGFICISLS